MKSSPLSHLVDPVREMLYQFDFHAAGYKNETGAIIAGYSCDIFPVEVLAACGVTPLKLPSVLRNGPCMEGAMAGLPRGVYDLIIVPEQCACAGLYVTGISPVYTFGFSGGWGEDASVAIHDSLAVLLNEIGLDIKKIDIERLKAVTGEYNDLRRTIRGIASVRKEKPDLLSNADLGVLFESMVLPPSRVRPFLAAVLDALNRTKSDYEGQGATALVYYCLMDDASLLDDIEEAGCVIAEDDSCSGRRQYDISLNASSDYLFYELLDAYSFRPYCPSVRPGSERYELLYRLLGERGIDFVVFFDDGCQARRRDIDFLRIRLMRLGIDPIVVDRRNAVTAVKDYLGRI